MDAEEKKQDYAGWKPRKLSSEEERSLLDGIRRRNDERKRAEGFLPERVEDVKKQMDGMLPASDTETVKLMPGYFRERTSEEQAEYNQYKADRADFDRWTKTSPIAKSRLAFAKKADFNQRGRDKIQNELIETWRAEKGLRSFADMNNLDALQGKIDMLKRRASEKSGVLDKARLSDFRPTQFGGITSVHDADEKQELGIIGKAESLYNDLSDIVSYAKEFKKRGGYGSSAGEFWKGFKDALSKLRTIDLGITDLFESNAYKEIVRKAQGGGELTDQEKAVLELDQLYKEVSSAFNPSKSYKGGYNTGVSLPFMAEFALNPVSGAGKAVAKAVGKSLVAKGAKEGAKGLSKFAARVVSSKGGELALRTMADVFVTAPAMTATSGMPRVLAEANRRMIEDGDTPLSATLKAGTASWIEYMSEGLGGAVDVGLSKAGRLMFGNGMEKLAATAVGRKLSALGKSSYAGAVRRMKGAANVQSFLSENIEEHIGNIVNHFTIGDVTKEDLLNLDTYLDTAIPIAVTQVAFGIASVGGYSLQVGRVSRAAKKAEKSLGQFMPPEEQAKLAEKLRDMPLDVITGLVKRQIQKAVENERQAAQTEDESLAAVYMQDAKKARSAAAYVYAQTQKNILVGAKSQVDEEKEQAFTQERDKIKAEYIASMPAAENGSHRMARLNGEGGEAVQVMTDISTYEVEERGKIITRFRSSDNTAFIMHEDGTKEQVRVDQLLFDKELPWVDNVDETATNLANMDASKFFEDLEAEREAEFESAQVETEKEGLRIENGEMAMMSQEDGSLVPVTIADTSMIDDGVVGIVMQDDSMDVVPVESLSAYEVPEEPQPYTEEERALQEEAGIGSMEKLEGAQYDEALAEENADGLSFDDLEAPDAARMLRDQIPDADGAIEFVEDEIKAAKKELTSIKRTKAKGATVEERARSFQERRNRIKDAESRISRLESIRSELSGMGMAEMERINNEESVLDVEAKTGEELAAMMLMSGTKLIYSDFKRHTGYGDKEARGMFGIFASAEKGGIGIERFGEILMEMDEDGRFFDHENAMSAVDAILSLFQSVRKRGDLYKFITNNEQARREEEMKKSMSEEEYFIRQAFGMSMDEYSAYLRMFQDGLLAAEDYKKLEEIIAEEYGKGAGDQGRDSEDTGDGQGRASGSPVSNDELLRRERTGDESGTIRMEERGDAAGERGDSDGSLQDEVKNDNFAEDGISERISQASDGADSGKADGGLQSADQLRRGIEEASRDARGGEKEVNRAIEALAKSLGLWIPFENLSSLGSPFVGGNENTNYLDENGTIYKVNNLMNSGTIVDLFNRIDLHNAIFPNTRYELVGVSGFGNGSSIYPVYKQYFVRDAEFATPENIDSYMRSLGFEKTSKEAEYSNGEYVVSDLRPRNVLKDADGDIYVIDAGIEPVASVSDRIAEEREKVEPNPTEAQKEAGNYRKGHVKLDGFDITIETPKGGVRRGVAADGKEWSIEMQHDYGYIRGTKGKDGDHIDVFLSESPEDGAVFVVDQVKEDGSFDEHKVMYGFASLEEAKAAYLSNYSAGWKGLGNISEVSREDFKRWVESSTRKTKPFAEYVQIARKQESAVRSGEIIEPDSDNVGAFDVDNPDIRFRRSDTPIRESDREVFARGQISSTIPDGFASTHFAYEPNLAHIYEDPTAYYELEKLAKENGGVLPEGWEYDFSPEDFRLKRGYVCCKQSDNYEYPQYIMGAGDDGFCVFFEGEKVATIYDGVVAKVGKVLDAWERKGGEYVQVDSEDAKVINHERFRAPMAWDELLRRSPKLQMQQKIREEVGSLSKQLNVPVNFVFSRDLKGKKAQSKGWYDGKTGEIFIVLDENVDVEDAVATVMHEVVAHKGLRDMLGRAEHDALMDEVFNVIPEDVISELKGFYWDDTKSEARNRRVLADEYVALLAETYQAPSVIERIAAAVRAAFRKLGISLKMNDGDIMYMLYLSKNRLTNRDSSRTTIDKMDRLQTAKQFANEYDNIMFRMPIEEVENSLYEDYPIEIATYMRAKLSSRWYRWTEAHQDAMRSWKLFIDKLKDVKESENVYMMENIMGSRAADKVSRFEHDRMKPLETSIRKLKKAVKLNDEGFSLYLISKHAPERNEYMRKKAVENLEKERGGLFRNLSDEDFRLEVERAMKKDYSGEKAVERELKALGYDSLQAYTDHVENTAGSELINTLWDRLRAATGHSIKEWYDCGMMGREAYQEMKSRYRFYVPLRGHMGEVAKDIFRYYKAEVDPRFSDPNERAEGRKSIADNPLPYIRQMAHSAIIAGSKNLVKMCAYRLASSHKNDVLFIGTQYYEVRKDGDGNIIDYIPIYPDINADDSEEEMREKMMDFHGRTKRGLENGSIVREAKGVQDMKLFATDQQVKEHICTLKINGRSFYLIAPMHPELTQSITGRNRDFADGAIIRSVAAVTNFMAKNYTSRSPNFMLSNFSRDVWWSLGSLFTREGTGYTMGFVRNIPLAFKEQFKGRKNSVVLDEFYKSGAATGFVTTLKESEYKKSYKNRASTSHWFVAKKMWYGLWESFSVPNVFFENATRLAVFMTSRQEGRSLARSAYDAKEASVNFNRKGSGKMGAAQLKSFFAFYNAGVQGLDAYGKLWGANWRKTLFLHGMAVFLGAAPYIVAALTGDDEMRKKYFALPDYVRRNNLVIPLWGDSFLKIPLPIEARAYHAIGDIFGGLFRGEISGKQAALATVSSMMDMFPINFFDAHGGIEKGAKLYELGDHTGALAATLGGVIPTAFRPLTEVVANMNYSGGKIYNETDWNAHLPAYRKAGYFTNPWMVEGAKALNKATGGDEVTPGRVNINPSIAEHYMMGYIGGVMTFLNQSAKTGISVFGEEEVNWNQVPVSNRFFLQDKKILQKKIDRDFRDVSDDMKLIQKRESGYRKILKEGNWVEQGNAATKLDEMYESGSIDLSEAYKSAAEHIKKMRKYMEDLEDKGEKDQMEKEITDIKADFLEYKKSIDDGREEEKGKTA